MTLHIHDRFHRFLTNLECLDCAGQHDAVVAEVLETYGLFRAPSGRRSHLWELDLHDINAIGASAEEAIANWKRLAHAKTRSMQSADGDAA